MKFFNKKNNKNCITFFEVVMLYQNRLVTFLPEHNSHWQIIFTVANCLHLPAGSYK